LGEPIKVVAVIAANPALSSILTMVLAATSNLRVRQFESQTALATYMRLSPVDLLVCDFDCEEAPASVLARSLRFDESVVRRDFQIIALASSVTENTKQASIASGIDEVIVKPMSPKYLLERVQSRLKRVAAQVAGGRYQGPERRGRLPVESATINAFARGSDNVVPLFREQPVPHLQR
jgi:two-component system phosphate regulon response regulator PhoB